MQHLRIFFRHKCPGLDILCICCILHWIAYILCLLNWSITLLNYTNRWAKWSQHLPHYNMMYFSQPKLKEMHISWCWHAIQIFHKMMSRHQSLCLGLPIPNCKLAHAKYPGTLTNPQINYRVIVYCLFLVECCCTKYVPFDTKLMVMVI